MKPRQHAPGESSGFEPFLQQRPRRVVGALAGTADHEDLAIARELAVESAPGAVNIPLGQLRSRLAELPRDRKILVVCRSGQRAYYATRLLLQNGFAAENVSGGMLARAQASTFWES